MAFSYQFLNRMLISRLLRDLKEIEDMSLGLFDGGIGGRAYFMLS